MNLLWLACALMAPPALSVDSASVDRGEVRGGPILKQTFRVTNASAETIVLAGLDSGCGCLKRAVSKNELKPGETADVSMDVNTLTQPDGPQTWTLKLRHRPASRAKAEPDETLELRVSAKLVREVSVTPPMISVSTDAAATATIALADKRTAPLTITKVAASSPHLVPKFAGKDGKYAIELAIAADLPAGTHDETVTVFTDDAHYAELRIPARIVKRAKNAVNAYPESLDLEAGRGIVQFRRADGQPVKIESATCATAGVTVTASTGSGPVATVKVVASSGRGKADVTVTFAEPAGATRTVPVRWGD
jgi:Protein of unknown function (DUF1573)